MKQRAELHCHSHYSKDCNLSVHAIIDRCAQKQINVIALTDHNEIAGALELRKQAPEWLRVIVGEEIATNEGDVIGLFLQGRIAPKQPIMQTITAIHDQGGLVLLPHPFDRLRHEAVGKKVVPSILREIDFIETFNARCIFPGDNHAAAHVAETERIPGFVGSDAHLASEYGNALNIIEGEWNSTEQFAERLRQAHFITQTASPVVHLQTKLVKMRKRRP